MLGTSLVVGWFLAMRLAKQDGIDQQEAGTIYMWTAVWSIIGSRLLWFITTPPSSTASPRSLMVNRGGLVAYGGMIGGFLASWYGCRKRGIPLLQWADVAAPSVVLGHRRSRASAASCSAATTARARTCPGRCASPGRTRCARTAARPGSTTCRTSACAQSPRWSYPGAPDADLRVAGRPVPVRAADAASAATGRFSGQVFLGWVLGYGILRPLIEIVRDDDDQRLCDPVPASALDVADHRHRVGRAGARPARRAACAATAAIPRARGCGCSRCRRRRRRPRATAREHDGGGKRRKRR